MRKAICDKCKKEIEVDEDYVSVNSLIEHFDEMRMVTSIGGKEISVFHIKCADKRILPLHWREND